MDNSDPRVVALLAHARACERARIIGTPIPHLPDNIKNLSGIDLSYAGLQYVNLTGANLIDSSLTSARLAYANLTDANLTFADLSNANFRYANLTRANLTGADLSIGDFTGADLTGTNIILLTAKEDNKSRRRLLAQFDKNGLLQLKQIRLTR